MQAPEPMAMPAPVVVVPPDETVPPGPRMWNWSKNVARSLKNSLLYLLMVKVTHITDPATHCLGVNQCILVSRGDLEAEINYLK